MTPKTSKKKKPTKTKKISVKKSALRKKLIKKAPREKAAPKKAPARKKSTARGKSRNVAITAFEPTGLGARSGGQSGDLQGLSDNAGADSESVDESPK